MQTQPVPGPGGVSPPSGGRRLALTVLADHAYETLRHEIVRGILRPNDRLIELELAGRLEMSRTPIREGLQRLASDGLVSGTTHGWIVREHQPHEIRAIYETRAALEGFASYLAGQRATADQLQRLAALEPLVPASGIVTDIPPEDLVERNNMFHDAVIGAAGNPVLSEMIIRTRTHFFNYRLARLYTREELQASSEGHRRLIQALLRHDPEGAERITRDHILEALNVTLHRLA
jgi:DNA-binding GntR family transcriptional regulator